MNVPNPTRRHVLLGALAAAGSSAVAACSSHRSATGTRTQAASATSPYVGDLRIAALSAALENQAVAAHRQVATALRSGTYATPSAALAAQVTLAQRDHQAHADAWNALLTAAGLAPVSGVPLTSASSNAAAVAAATTPAAAAALLLTLEQELAASCLDTAAAAHGSGSPLAARTAPVEAAHAAVLSVLLGRPPAGGSYLTTAGAARTSALTI